MRDQPICAAKTRFNPAVALVFLPTRESLLRLFHCLPMHLLCSRERCSHVCQLARRPQHHEAMPHGGDAWQPGQVAPLLQGEETAESKLSSWQPTCLYRSCLFRNGVNLIVGCMGLDLSLPAHISVKKNVFSSRWREMPRRQNLPTPLGRFRHNM